MMLSASASTVRLAGNSSAMTTRRQVTTVATRRSSHKKEKKHEVSVQHSIKRTATTAAGTGLATVDLACTQEIADLVTSLNNWGMLTAVAAPSFRLFRPPSATSEPHVFGPAFGSACNGAFLSGAAASRRCTSSVSSSGTSTEALHGAPPHEIAMATLLAFAGTASFLAGGQLMNASAASSSSSSSSSYGSGDNSSGNWGGGGAGPPGGGDATYLAAAALSSYGWGAEDPDAGDEERQDWDNLDDASLVTESVAGSWDKFWASVRVGQPFLGGRALVGSGRDEAATTSDESKTVEAAAQAGTNSRTRPDHYEVSVKALRGGRLSMEDEWVVAEGGRFAAVFDGHGGGGVSSFLRESFYSSFLAHVRRLQRDQQQRNDSQDEEQEVSKATLGGDVNSRVAAMRAAFHEMERHILADETFDYQGSTAVTVAVHEDDDGRRTILSGNVGDSRAILSRRGRAVDLTRDHKPNDDVEKRRILDMGEQVEWDSYSRVYRVRNLSLSRAIGDKFAKPAVSPEAEIKVFPCVSSSDLDPAQAMRSDGSADSKGVVLDNNDDDEFVVLASDGLWDVMSSQDVVNFVHRRLSAPPAVPTTPSPTGPQPSMAASALAKRPTWSAKSTDEQSRILKGRRKNMSKYLAQEAILRGSGDNVCVVLVWLKDQEAMAKEQEEARQRRKANSIAARLTSRR